MHGLIRNVLAWAFIVVLGTLAFAAFVSPYWQGARSVRQVKVEKGLFTPETLTPYRSLVVRSPKELQEVLNGLQTGPFLHFKEVKNAWLANCRNFDLAVRASKLDFSSESLVLIPHTEGSGSIKVGLSKPYLRSKKLVCNIWRDTPGALTLDMAYHCFALIVQNDKVAEVEIWIDGKRNETLSVGKQQGE